MVAGHYGVGFIAKALNNAVPLWVLFLAVQLVDIFWAVLVLLKIERARIVPGITPINPIDFYYMPYTHSLAGVVLWSIAAATISSRMVTGRQRWSVAAVVGAAVLSHWVLDLLVHRPILPLYGDGFKVGIGLYHLPAVALGLELALLFGGIYLYLRRTKPRRAHRSATIILGLVITGLLGFVAFAPPLRKINAAATSALVTYLVLAGAAYWIERQRVE
ncbi:MAG: hypothetical protein ACREP3_16920 [Candidatus Binatia bacterium]